MFRSGKNIEKLKYEFAPAVVILLTIWAFVQIYFSFFILPKSNDECLWEYDINKLDSLQRAGVTVKWNEKDIKGFLDSAKIIIKSVKKGGVTWNAGIRDGDYLLKINGVKLNKISDASFLLDNLASGDTAIYTVQRGGKIFNAKVRVKKLISFSSIASELFALVWLIVGFIVYRSKPSGEIQRRFFTLGILLTLYNSWALTGSISIPTPFTTHKDLYAFTTTLWLLSGIFIPTKIVEFFWIFPYRRKRLDNKIVKKILLLYPYFLLAIYLAFKLFIYPKFPFTELGVRSLTERMIWGIIYFSMITALFTGFFSLIFAYRKIKSKEERKPLLIIIIGFAIGLGGFIYASTLAKVFADTIFNSPQHYMPIILIALIPISFGYSIFKYSLMDVSEVVKNTFLYLVVSIFIAALYFFSIILMGASFASALGPQYQGLIIGLVFILFVILYQSTKDKFQAAITRKFYPEQEAFKKMLVKFSNDVSGIVDYDGVVEETRKIFSEALNLQTFAFAVYDRKTEKLKIVSSYNLKTAKFEIHLSVKTLEKWIKGKRLYREYLNIEREDFLSVFGDEAEVLIQNQIFTAMPLVARDKLIGFLFLGLKHSGARFTDNDLEMLSATVNQVAVALQNALYHNEEKEKAALERDFENARRIQRSLLPRKLPQIEGVDIFGEMVPAQWVGGDYYDVIRLDEKRFYVLVADVSGKGFSASFYMSKLQTIARLFCSEGLSPREILIKINDKISATLERYYFITITIGLFDMENRTLKISRAGHTPVKKAAAGLVENIIPRGLAIGMKSGKVFDDILEEVTLPFGKNELFLFYSDGVNEERNEKDKLLGDAFIDKTITENFNKSAAELWNELLTGIVSFRGNNEQSDDITMVIVKT